MFSIWKRNFLYYSIHTIFTKAFVLGLGLVLSVLMARFLGPDGRGLVAMLQAVPLMIIAFGELGIRQSTAYLIGQKKYTEADVQGSMMSLYFITAAASLVVVFLSYSAMGMYKYGVFLASIFALFVPAALFERYAKGLLLGRKLIEKTNHVDWLHQTGTVIMMFVLVGMLGLGVKGAGAAFLFAQVLSSLLVLYWVGKHVSIRPRWVPPIPGEMVRRGIVYALSLFVLMLNYRIDVIILGELKGPASVGIYSVGVNFCELLKQIPAAIGVVIFAHSVSWDKNKNKESLSKIAIVSRLMFFLTLVLSLIVAFAAKWLIPLLYGDAFRGSYLVVLFLMPGVVFLTVFMTLQYYLAGQGKPELGLYAFIPALAINIILNFLLIPKYDYYGAAVASTISYSAAVILYLVLFCNINKTKIKDYFLLDLKDIGFLVGNLRIIDKTVN